MGIYTVYSSYSVELVDSLAFGKFELFDVASNSKSIQLHRFGKSIAVYDACRVQ